MGSIGIGDIHRIVIELVTVAAVWSRRIPVPRYSSVAWLQYAVSLVLACIIRTISNTGFVQISSAIYISFQSLLQ